MTEKAADCATDAQTLAADRIATRFAELPKNQMASWYDPVALLRTLLDIVVSGVLQSRLDRRTLQTPFKDSDPAQAAAEDECPPVEEQQQLPVPPLIRREGYFEYVSPTDDLWFDYASDVGDGFNSTYHVASLLARARLLLANPPAAANQAATPPQDLKRGRFLVLGGDQIYPSATREAYEQRFIRPYEAAAYSEQDHEAKKAPHLYALPGNHDWYDGLGSFMEVFGDQRQIGQWRTVQKSSYFAIKLPHGFWLFAIDIGLAGELDKKQVQYFQYLVEHQLVDGDRIILCMAEPDWVKARPNVANLRDGLFYFERKLAERLVEKTSGAEPARRKDVRIVLRIAGDLHHYRRHESREPLHPTDAQVKRLALVDAPAAPGVGLRTIQNITAGGGGAFLHPTHEIAPERGNTDGQGSLDQYPPGLDELRFTCVKAFPDVATSRKLTSRARRFGLQNKALWAILAIVYWMIFNLSLYMYANGRVVWTVVMLIVVSVLWIFGTGEFAKSEASGEIGGAKHGRCKAAFRSQSVQDAASKRGHVHGALHVVTIVLMTGLTLFLHTRLEHYFERCGWIAAGPQWDERELLPYYDETAPAAATPMAGTQATRPEPTAASVASPATIESTRPHRHWHVPLSTADRRSLLRFLFAALAGALGALGSLTIFGFYLEIALNRYQLHANGAFAALRSADYKNFLRIRVTRGKLVVYAIGITEVPKKWQPPAAPPTGQTGALFAPDGLKPENQPFLIEPPIEIPR